MTASSIVKPFLGKIPYAGDWLSGGVGWGVGNAYKEYDKRLPELEDTDRK